MALTKKELKQIEKTAVTAGEQATLDKISQIESVYGTLMENNLERRDAKLYKSIDSLKAMMTAMNENMNSKMKSLQVKVDATKKTAEESKELSERNNRQLERPDDKRVDPNAKNLYEEHNIMWDAFTKIKFLIILFGITTIPDIVDIFKILVGLFK